MESVKVLPLDYNANLPENYIDEEQPVTASNRDWYRPDYAPFYEKDFELYDGDGMLLRKGVHYVFETLSDELLMKTGKPVRYFFRILNLSLNTKKKYRIKYRSVGNTGFPRSLIAKMVNELLNSDYWVDWDTQVLGKPDTYPAYQHWHDVATEVANWDQFISFATQHLNFVMGAKKLHFDRQLELIKTAAEEMKVKHKVFWKKLNDHDQDYNNPHQLVRSDFPLTEIPNVPLASVSEDLDGKLRSRFTTPMGLQLAAKKKARVAPGLVRGGDSDLTCLAGVSPLSVIGYARDTKLNLLKNAALHRDQNGNVTIFTGEGQNERFTSIWSTPQRAYFTGEQYQLIQDKPDHYSSVYRTCGKGIVVGKGADLILRYYPDPKALVDKYSSDYLAMNMQPIKTALGNDWANRVWFVPAKGAIYILGLVSDSGPRSKIRFFKVTYTDIAPYPELQPITYRVQQENTSGDLGAAADTHLMIDRQAGGLANTWRDYHHAFDREVSVNESTHGFSIAAEEDPYDNHRVNIKIMTGFTANNVEYPIEVSWVLDNKREELLRVPGGSNARRVQNTSAVTPFDTEFNKLVKLVNANTYPSVCFTQTGDVLFYYGGKTLTRPRTVRQNVGELYRLPISSALYRNSVILETALIESEILESDPSAKWMVAIPNDCPIIYRGQRGILKARKYDLREATENWDPTRPWTFWMNLLWETNGPVIHIHDGMDGNVGVQIGSIYANEDGVFEINYQTIDNVNS